MKFLYKFRLLPLMMLVASLAFMIRVGDFVTGLNNMGSAQAQQEVAASPPPMNSETIAQADTEAEEGPANDIEGRLDLDAKGDDLQLKTEFQEKPLVDPAAETAGEKVEWKDANDTEIEDSEVKADLYKDLAKRRELLDKKEKEIGVREALLSAAERELDQKLRELTNLQTEIEASMKKRSAEEEARITSLVKIYEGMKPKDAASILNTMDLEVLLVIMTQMSERKSSPIMAEMNPDRARTLTIMMSQQRQAPSLPNLN
ncbi:MAG: MotE family protein [Micavibrio sp.]